MDVLSRAVKYLLKCLLMMVNAFNDSMVYLGAQGGL
jgi:hypothetical protein